MKNKKRIIFCLLIVCILLMVSISSAGLNSNQLFDESSRFPPDFMFILGRYTNIEKEQNGIIRRSLIIQSDEGRIFAFGGHWSKGSGYCAWSYGIHIWRKVTFIEAPCFYGFCRNGCILGVTFGSYELEYV